MVTANYVLLLPINNVTNHCYQKTPSAARVNCQDMRYAPSDMHVGANATTMQQMVKETKDALINASLAHSVAMVST